MRRSGFDRSRTARASDLTWHTRSTPARRRRHLHFWLSDLRNLARDLYGRVDWVDGDSGVVFASHAVSNPFWNGGIWLSVDKHGAADRAIHEHSSGWLIRIGEVLNGPLALILRFFGLVPFAAISFLLGALVSRIGWIAVGKVSGSDPESVFAAERY